MTEEKKFNWDAGHLRDQINEVFYGKDFEGEMPEEMQEVWDACHKAGAWASMRVHAGLGEVISGNGDLPTADGKRHEIMGLLPGAQYLMATVGVAGALLDSILGAITQDSEGEGGGSIGAKAPIEITRIREAVRDTIIEIRNHTAEQVEAGVAELFPDPDPDEEEE